MANFGHQPIWSDSETEFLISPMLNRKFISNAVNSFNREIHFQNTPLTDQSHSHCVKNSASNKISYEKCNFVMGFENFKVHVNGETLDSEIPPDVRMKYYQLCCSQNKLIHDRVLNGVVVGLIIEIVRITDISISPEDLESYEKTLNSCQAIDMAVESLQAKLCALIKFSKEHQTIDEPTRLKVAELEKQILRLKKKKSKILGLDLRR